MLAVTERPKEAIREIRGAEVRVKMLWLPSKIWVAEISRVQKENHHCSVLLTNSHLDCFRYNFLLKGNVSFITRLMSKVIYYDLNNNIECNIFRRATNTATLNQVPQ